jgi:MFS family permease
LGSGAYNYCFYLLLTWLPVYLHRGLKMDARSAVLWTALPWLCAAVAGFGVGGLLVDRLIKQGRDASAVRKAVLITGTSLGLCVVAPACASEPRVVLVCLSIGISGLSMASPVVWSLPALLAPRSAGRVGGVMNFWNQLAGIVAPIVTGYISSITHSFAGAFLIAAVILALGIVSYAVLLGRIEQIPEPANAPA